MSSVIIAVVAEACVMIGTLEFVPFDVVMSVSSTDISSCAVCNCLYRGCYVMP